MPTSNNHEWFLAKAARVASAIFVVGGAALVLLSFYFFYHYTWTGQRQFSSWRGVVLYYVVPGILASLLFLCLRLTPTQKVNCTLLGLSLAGSVYGVELFLEWSDSTLKEAFGFTSEPDERKQKAEQIAKRFGVDVDVRNPIEFLADVRKRNGEAVPIVAPSNSLFIKQPDGSIKSAVAIRGAEVVPIGAISNKLTVLCNENGNYVTYPSDQFGFHNSEGVWKSNSLDILALGDSFAHGYCVPSDQNFVDLIRQRYPTTLNLGMAGNGPLLMLASLKEYGARFKPKTVLWFYYEGNDLTNLQTEKRNRILMRYLKDDFSQDLISRQRDIDNGMTADIPRQIALGARNRAVRLVNRQNIVEKLSGALRFSALRDRLKLEVGTSMEEVEQLRDLEGANMDLFRDILSQAKARIGAWTGTLYFVYLPTWGRYVGDISIAAEQRPRVLALVDSLGIPMIDLHPSFQDQSDPASLFPFREYGHYTEKGHRLVAEEVLRALEREVQKPSELSNASEAGVRLRFD